MKRAVLFDMGNTLVRYWDRPAWPGILDEALREVERYLAERGSLCVPPEKVKERVEEENHSAPDYRVQPLQGKLTRIYELEGTPAEVREEACRRFMVPIFQRGQVYPDSVPTLRELRARGLRTAILSNTPWGSPAPLWREELTRLGLVQEVDLVVFCDDVGWRKPAAPIFLHTVAKLGVAPHECLFVGDDPRWDIVGPRALGMDAVLIDRWDKTGTTEEGTIHALDELREVLDIQ